MWVKRIMTVCLMVVKSLLQSQVKLTAIDESVHLYPPLQHKF
jgi:hypothetical protein